MVWDPERSHREAAGTTGGQGVTRGEWGPYGIGEDDGGKLHNDSFEGNIALAEAGYDAGYLKGNELFLQKGTSAAVLSI